MESPLFPRHLLLEDAGKWSQGRQEERPQPSWGFLCQGAAWQGPFSSGIVPRVMSTRFCVALTPLLNFIGRWKSAAALEGSGSLCSQSRGIQLWMGRRNHWLFSQHPWGHKIPLGRSPLSSPPLPHLQGLWGQRWAGGKWKKKNVGALNSCTRQDKTLAQGLKSGHKWGKKSTGCQFLGMGRGKGTERWGSTRNKTA